ncbi:MAG: leucine-rich repeat protein [Oscillospiraceae bacterium]|nr:leucine-rich repeat protein [Oscillospiraceae bacterium]
MKMKKMLAVVSALCMMGAVVPMLPVQETAVISASARGAESTYENLKYKYYGDGVKITGCTDETIQELVIPAEIDGLPVIEISWNAFSNCSNLASVSIPESVIYITADAFSGTPWLKAKQEENPCVVVNGILIDASTCTGDAVIPDTVKKINYGAFSGSAITSVTIPDNLTAIDNTTFADCELTSINVSETHPVYASEDGVLFNKDKTELILYPPKSERTEYTIPDGVKIVKDSAFENCLNLTSVTIPDTITNVCDDAFSADRYPVHENYYGGFLTDDADNYIAPKAFAGCLNLKEIHVSEQNTGLSSENGILFNKDKTTLISYPCAKEGDSYTIPDSVTVIQGGAFKSSLLKEITIPESVTSIGRGAFCCSALTSVTIPESVTTVEKFAFSACPDLETVTFENPKCGIEGGADSIYNTYEFENGSNVFYFDGTIYGSEDSTAKVYTKKYDINFELAKASSDTAEILVLGDADGSGKVDIVDAIVLNKAILGKETLTENGLKAIDFNGNGKPDAEEAQTLLKYIVGLITDFTE